MDYRKVEVEWEDSLAISEGWQTAEEYIESGALVTCTSIGYLVHQDDEILMLAMSIDPANEHVNHGCSIPAKSVRRITDLESVRKGLWTPEKVPQVALDR